MPAEAAAHRRPARPLLGGVAMGAASRIAVTIAGAATAVVLARVLGPRGWGTYFLAQSLVAILTAASTLGVEHGIAYFVGAGRWTAAAAFRSSLRVSATAGVGVAGLAVAVRVLVPSAFAGLSVWLTAVAAAALPFGLAWLYLSYIALATDRYEISMSLPAIQAVLVVLAVVPAAVWGGVSGAVVAGALATVAVGVGAALWGSARLVDEPGSGFRLRSAVAFGIKGYAANALQLVSYRVDLFILSAVASTVAVGRYSLAVSLTSTLWLLPRALSDVLFPRVARLSAEADHAVLESVEEKSLRHVSLMIVGSVLAAAPLLELLVVPIFGETFRPSINLGLILLPGAAAIAASTVLAATIVGRGKPQYSLAGTAISTPLTVVLYAVLIPAFGATGAAIASSISYLGTFAIFADLYRRATGRSAFPLLVPTAAELSELKELAKKLVCRGEAGRL